jgi:hypothetical protein
VAERRTASDLLVVEDEALIGDDARGHAGLNGAMPARASSSAALVLGVAGVAA